MRRIRLLLLLKEQADASKNAYGGAYEYCSDNPSADAYHILSPLLRDIYHASLPKPGSYENTLRARALKGNE
jgi:hypothetical protein